MKIWLALLVLILMPLASAFTGTSANYNATIGNVNFLTADGSSANYNASLSLVQQPVETFASASYQGNVGFYYATGRFLDCFFAPDIYMFSLLLSIILFIVSIILDRDVLKMLSGMLLLVAGVAIMVNGLCVYNDWLTRSIAFVLLGLGLIQLFSVWGKVWRKEDNEEW